MTWTETVIGMIAFIETNANYVDSVKKVPKNARLMKTWELLRLWEETPKVLKLFPKTEYLWCDTARAGGLINFDGSSFFFALDRNVNYNDALRGVCVVKKKTKRGK